MQIIHAHEPIPSNLPCLFLAGPTPRAQEVCSWRPKVVALLEARGLTDDFSLVLPEFRTATINETLEHEEHYRQVQWEWSALGQANVILFWVPRDLETLPGFTTNVEFGYWAAKAPEKVVLGFPVGAPKMEYLETLAKAHSIPVSSSLGETVENALNLLLELLGQAK